MSLLRGGRRRLVAMAILLALALLVPALAAANPSIAAPTGDLGDAPDSTNHFFVGMLAYPAVLGRFPTVFDPALGVPQGPLHLNPAGNGWLGQAVSRETDADQGPDADGPTNLNPPANVANLDRFDDGIPPVNPGGIINLPQCARTQFRYIVTGAAVVPAPNNYVNVWFDWNRDGDWADTFTCTTPTGALIVREWAVQNQPVNVVPGSVVWATPPFASFHPAGHSNIWMRINIAETPVLATTTMPPDGRGPAAGYNYGETEDYIAVFGGGVAYKPQ